MNLRLVVPRQGAWFNALLTNQLIILAERRKRIAPPH
jgi:hypothetical protein